MQLGTVVEVCIPNTLVSEGLVLGTMRYAEDHGVILVGSGRCIGMPVSKDWVRDTGVTDRLRAISLRGRYEALYPNVLHPLEA